MLLTLTLVTVALVVIALAGYLMAIVVALTQAKKNVAAIADGLEAVAGHTEPLSDKLGTTNEALRRLLAYLQSAQDHLTRVYRLVHAKDY